MDRIFPYGHFCDPWGIPNQKIWVSNPGIFSCISVLSRPPCAISLNLKLNDFLEYSTDRIFIIELIH